MKKITLVFKENDNKDIEIKVIKGNDKTSTELEKKVYNFIFDNINNILNEISKKGNENE